MSTLYFVTVDANGALTGSYPSDVAAAPDGAIELSANDWIDFLDNQHERRWDGSKVVPYTPPPPPPKVPDMVPMWAAQAALADPSVAKYDAINLAIIGDPSADPPKPGMRQSNPSAFFAWTMGNFASRKSALMAALADQFGMTESAIDALFVSAEKLSSAAG